MNVRTSDDVSLRFLSFCAITGDFSMLVDGSVRPEYLSENGAAIAQWILELRGSTTSWPPNYQSLKEQFPQLKWPRIKEGATGLDPRIAAFAVYQAMKATYVGEIMESTARLQEIDIFTEQDEVQEILAYTRSVFQEINYLSKPTRVPKRFGHDPDAFMDAILGRDLPETIRQFEHPDSRVHALVDPLEYGLYVFFARPKNMKSIILQDAAIYHSIIRGYRSVLSDQENSKNVLARRFACYLSGIDADAVKEIRRKYSKRQPLQPVEIEILGTVEDAVFEVFDSSALLLIGKDEIDAATGKLVIDDVLEAAEDWGADVLFVEQMHKYTDRTLRSNATEWSCVRSVVAKVADSSFATFGTTQERKNDKKRSTKELYSIREADEQMVFGGDAVSHNCNGLFHVQKWDLGPNDFLQRITPCLSRDSSDEPFYIRRSLYTNYEELDFDVGEAMAEAHLARARMETEERKKNAAREVTGSDDSGPPSTGAIVTPSAVPQRPPRRRAMDAALDPTLIDRESWTS